MIETDAGLHRDVAGELASDPGHDESQIAIAAHDGVATATIQTPLRWLSIRSIGIAIYQKRSKLPSRRSRAVAEEVAA